MPIQMHYGYQVNNQTDEQQKSTACVKVRSHHVVLCGMFCHFCRNMPHAQTLQHARQRTAMHHNAMQMHHIQCERTLRAVHTTLGYTEVTDTQIVFVIQ